MRRIDTTEEFIRKNYVNLHMSSGGQMEAQFGFSFITIYPTVTFGKNIMLGNFIVIEDWCELGDNVLIGNASILRPETIVGSNTKIGHCCVFEGDVQIGERCAIQSQCHITHGARIGYNVLIAPGVIGINDKEMDRRRDWQDKPFRIKDDARVGAGSVICAGVTIGKRAFVKPGSVVENDVPDDCIVGGNPATVLGKLTIKKEKI